MPNLKLHKVRKSRSKVRSYKLKSESQDPRFETGYKVSYKIKSGSQNPKVETISLTINQSQKVKILNLRLWIKLESHNPKFEENQVPNVETIN